MHKRKYFPFIYLLLTLQHRSIFYSYVTSIWLHYTQLIKVSAEGHGHRTQQQIGKKLSFLGGVFTLNCSFRIVYNLRIFARIHMIRAFTTLSVFYLPLGDVKTYRIVPWATAEAFTNRLYWLIVCTMFHMIPWLVFRCGRLSVHHSHLVNISGTLQGSASVLRDYKHYCKEMVSLCRPCHAEYRALVFGRCRGEARGIDTPLSRPLSHSTPYDRRHYYFVATPSMADC